MQTKCAREWGYRIDREEEKARQRQTWILEKRNGTSSLPQKTELQCKIKDSRRKKRHTVGKAGRQKKKAALFKLSGGGASKGAKERGGVIK